jgi:hypothetical protein
MTSGGRDGPKELSGSGAVVGLERDTQVELQDPVATEQGPVSPPAAPCPGAWGLDCPLAIGAVTRCRAALLDLLRPGNATGGSSTP